MPDFKFFKFRNSRHVNTGWGLYNIKPVGRQADIKLQTGNPEFTVENPLLFSEISLQPQQLCFGEFGIVAGGNEPVVGQLQAFLGFPQFEVGGEAQA